VLSELDVSEETSLVQESPEYVRTSLAAAITLGLVKGRIFRGAKLYCLNLLLTYGDGCVGRCAYCGLSRARETVGTWNEQSFIRVDWPVVSLDEIINMMSCESCSHVERICISMITNWRAPKDTIRIVRRIREKTDAISVLIAPTIVDENWLREVKWAGADKVGIAVDAATSKLFQRLRSPHKLERYWRTVEAAVQTFGRHNVGIHLIVGLGETEKDMIETIQKAHRIGALAHLFSFFPEEGSLMQEHKQPPIGSYRRVQLARYLINKNLTTTDKMKFDGDEKLLDFGVGSDILNEITDSGLPFMTSGCSTKKRENACNRPFSDSTPYQAYIGEMRNFPFEPDEKDVIIIKKQLWDYSDTSVQVWVEGLDCEDCLSTI
jgi:biotin synthase